MSTQSLLRAALGALSIASLASIAPAAAGNIVRFDAAYAEPAPPADSPRACWRWSAGSKDWTWACRLGAYQRAYPVNPLKPPAPVRYDYPDTSLDGAGSTLSLILDGAGGEPRHQAHAD